jgi:glycerophosphoryl diester phosphodiesterase
MQIIEQNLVPKNPKKKSEDGIVVTDDFIAVIDGSTSKTDKRYSYFKSNGRYAMQLIEKYIRKAPKGISCHDFCIGVAKQINKHYKESDIPRLIEHPEERLTASAVIFSRLNREIWMIGDCQCMVGGTFYDNPKPYEQELAERRAQIIKEGAEPKEHYLVNDTARQQIIPRMLETMKQQNITYSVIDGFRIPEQYVRIITLDFQPWEIVLASDGYPFLCPTLQESEEKLAWQRENDPLNIGEFKATKAFAEGNNSFDDRSYIRFKV